MVKAIPDGYYSVTPYLVITNASEAIEWYKKAFGATEVMRLVGPDSKIMHGELQIGNSKVMLAEEMLDWGVKSPSTLGGAGVSICLYVEDADSVFGKAIEAGANEIRPLTDQFYGDRSGSIEDPFGHTWTIATHIEDLSPEEMKTRFQETMGG